MSSQATQEIASTGADTDISPQEQTNLYCLLFGRGDFKPTGNMCRLVVAFMADEENLSPMLILQKQGHAKWNWYKWQKEYPGFLKWWNTVIEDTIKDEHLSRLYLSLFKRALTHDTGAAKLIAQRYDPKYTERSQSDQRHSFQGYDPPAADESRERQRKALAKQRNTREQGLLTDNGGSPDNHTHATARDDKPAAGPITGVAPAYPGITRAIQAQSQSAEHTQGIDAALSNDNTLDSEPITKVDPPGPGLSR